MTDVRPESLDGSANALLELAGLLQAGRPESSLANLVESPNAHGEVADRTKAFAEFAQDQYQDGVALLAALSTRLKAAAVGYRGVDATTARTMDSFLTDSTYRTA